MSRRWRHPYARRGEFFQPPRSAAAPQPPALPPRVLRARIRFGALPRRGEFLPVPRSIGIVPAPLRQAGEYRLGVRGRHGVFLVTPPEPLPRPTFLRGAIHATALRVRLRRFVAPPLQVAAPVAPSFPSRLVRGRVRLAALRDGRFVAPPLQAAVQQPASFPPRTVRGWARYTAVRRGEFTCPPWAAQATPPPPWVPSPVAGHRRTLTIRRGQFAGCPAFTSTPPPFVSSGRSGAQPRRGRFTAYPLSPAWIPQPIRARQPSCSARRGQYVEPAWPQAVPPPPPALVPAVRRGRAAPPAYRVHGRMWLGWMELTVTPAPEDSSGHMSPRDRTAPAASGAIRPGPSIHARVRRTTEMEAM